MSRHKADRKGRAAVAALEAETDKAFKLADPKLKAAGMVLLPTGIFPISFLQGHNLNRNKAKRRVRKINWKGKIFETSAIGIGRRVPSVKRKKQAATSTPVLNTRMGAIHVGSRVGVFWDKDNTYYYGTVIELLGHKFLLEYDDGEIAEEDPKKEKFIVDRNNTKTRATNNLNSAGQKVTNDELELEYEGDGEQEDATSKVAASAKKKRKKIEPLSPCKKQKTSAEVTVARVSSESSSSESSSEASSDSVGDSCDSDSASALSELSVVDSHSSSSGSSSDSEFSTSSVDTPTDWMTTTDEENLTDSSLSDAEVMSDPDGPARKKAYKPGTTRFQPLKKIVVPDFVHKYQKTDKAGNLVFTPESGLPKVENGTQALVTEDEWKEWGKIKSLLKKRRWKAGVRAKGEEVNGPTSEQRDQYIKKVRLKWRKRRLKESRRLAKLARACAKSPIGSIPLQIEKVIGESQTAKELLNAGSQVHHLSVVSPGNLEHVKGRKGRHLRPYDWRFEEGQREDNLSAVWGSCYSMSTALEFILKPKRHRRDRIKRKTVIYGYTFSSRHEYYGTFKSGEGGRYHAGFVKSSFPIPVGRSVKGVAVYKIIRKGNGKVKTKVLYNNL